MQWNVLQCIAMHFSAMPCNVVYGMVWSGMIWVWYGMVLPLVPVVALDYNDTLEDFSFLPSS